jgi:hypothetical protein
MENVREGVVSQEVAESGGYRFTNYKGGAQFASDEIGTPENTALAMAAVAEECDEDRFLETMTAFNYSPLFRAAVLDYDRGHAAAIAIGEMDQDDDRYDRLLDESFGLRALCARMFIAGTLAERSARMNAVAAIASTN